MAQLAIATKCPTNSTKGPTDEVFSRQKSLYIRNGLLFSVLAWLVNIILGKDCNQIF